MWDFETFSVKAIRSILFIFNLFFAFTGLILLIIGLMIKGYFTQYEPFLDDKYFSASSLLIASGSIIFMIAFFGCCGAIKENRCMIITYSLFLAAVIILEFSTGVTGYVLTAETQDLIHNKLNESMKQYEKSPEMGKLWDSVQTQFMCCGVNSSKDWMDILNGSLPMSCCDIPSRTLNNATCSNTSPNLYHDSCKTKLSMEIENNTLLLGGVAFGIIVTQFLGIVFSCYLSRKIENSKYETV